jgi:putative hemolysin
MRSILLCAAGALTLAACQQPAAPADTASPEAADAAMDASATTGGGSGAAPASTAHNSSAGAMAAGDASADTAGAAPANDGIGGPTSQTARDTAKEKAEETNLHPRTP